MREFVKPTILISKCITFENVRWNAQTIASDFVEKLKPSVNFIPVCPEVQIGLGVPRNPLRIVLVNGEKRLIQQAADLDLTQKMQNFTESFLSSLRDVDGFILKSGSPSCGFKNVKIYPNIGKSASIGRGSGFFGGAVVEKFPDLVIEDEKRLLNSRIREHFLTKLYTHANFRIVKKSTSIRQLVRFHSENKLLLAAYNQKELKILGRIVANQEDVPFIQLIEFYLRALGGRGKDTIAKCHLCLDIRKHLVSKGDLEELKPKKFCQNL
ncbi:MAG: YbgA family protein [Candidatus Bathyarchaeia archaeon]